ncbi:hypothetical protein [Mesorhizobium sp. NZP2077]|uniref:hypothetical protein n=1 Tax=Mesorhizobium sp. NZP2077 TaxID=2483404 RepID=UPI0015546A45|nr:hypothetical protein [Mesorhizobium sp. NZP2077]QKC82791.1 hypothetical protein EB232_15265 [Mesorhizobium sp. NZP2077]QKD16289.1 hypothetical protein HGP13_15065 [Mesorhizobium sp. NZP2077]
MDGAVNRHRKPTTPAAPSGANLYQGIQDVRLLSAVVDSSANSHANVGAYSERGPAMKRAYVKPVLAKHQKLSAVTAQAINSNDSQAPE